MPRPVPLRLPAIAVLFLLIVSGCASSGPASDPDTGASVPESGLAPALRSELSAPTAALLTETAQAVVSHDWEAYRAVLSPEDFGEAVGFLVGNGTDRTAAISETMESVLSLGWASTRVFPDGVDRADEPTAGLDRIQTLRFDVVTDRQPDFDQFTVGGTVTLDDGTSLPISVTVLRPSGPAPVLAVPQG